MVFQPGAYALGPRPEQVYPGCDTGRVGACDDTNTRRQSQVTDGLTRDNREHRAMPRGLWVGAIGSGLRGNRRR